MRTYRWEIAQNGSRHLVNNDEQLRPQADGSIAIYGVCSRKFIITDRTVKSECRTCQMNARHMRVGS